ncbi:MAG: cation:proton antiporter, partial [Terrimicrobiaceae bacterium]|nr:cation:proton antiporter [Terrimicrobiaceae bacterium]
MSPFELSVRFFLQLAVILAACRVAGWVASKFGQPQVIGEMIAGVVLGPSVFGALAPAAHGWVFPPESRPVLFCASQVGLALYMFLVGVE